MISPEEASQAGEETADELSALEIAMLIEAAAMLAKSSLEGVDVAREAAELQVTCFEQSRRAVNVAEALKSDVYGLLEENAAREAVTISATERQTAHIMEMTERLAQEAYKEALRGASEIAANMASDVRRQYFQMTRAAALQVSSGNMGRDRATTWAVTKLAERGVTAFETTTARGIRRTPVDVAMRQVIQEALMARLTKQTISIAELCGEDLVEVSSHGGARPSHAKWQGKVYSLSGKSEKYPPFYERCMARGGDSYDPVDGYGGYNCRHTIGIYREGYHRRWQDDPLVGKGYDNDEVYALQQRQRRYENDIRKLKRQKEVLEANGLDAKAVNVRIRGKQAQLRQLIAENDSVLSRERWREQTARAARRKAGTEGIVHLDKRAAHEVKHYDEVRLNRFQRAKAEYEARVLDDAANYINVGAQRKHIRGTYNYKDHTEKLRKKTGKKNIAPSYITISIEECERLVREFAGKGRMTMNSKGWDKKEICHSDRIIGYNVDENGNETPTRYFKIHYSVDKGTHIVPTKDQGALFDED
ncbi:phage minor capsid protein [Denitrobacterium detoxificans]|nr:phage minor capsid protein [Denitrobacterium detoxificans]